MMWGAFQIKEGLMNQDLTMILVAQWQQLRGMSYDLLGELKEEDLSLKLNFERSQTIGYQFWCMLGAQESWLALIESGQWKGFSCSVNSIRGGDALERFKRQMQLADELLLQAMQKADLILPFEDGRTPLSHYLKLVEHEAHHQGQLINFIYAFDLPIPKSWEEKWHLKRD
jgi:uncharacterized damage-inducible protein DinB